MGFFNALKRLLPHASHAGASEESRQRICAAWGLEDDETGAETEADSDAAGQAEEGPSTVEAAGTNYSAFDRTQWQKKLRGILDELPASQPRWHELMTEAHALQLQPEWIADRQREEFLFVIRRAVANKVISEDEHQKLELARKLIGMSEAEAETALHSILAEAEAFFGTPVQDKR